MRHASLAIGDGRSGSAVNLSASWRVSVRVVERVERALPSDGDPKARARFEIADGEFDAVARRVPDELDFVGSAQSLGKLSSWRW